MALDRICIDLAVEQKSITNRPCMPAEAREGMASRLRKTKTAKVVDCCEHRVQEKVGGLLSKV